MDGWCYTTSRDKIIRRGGYTEGVLQPIDYTLTSHKDNLATTSSGLSQLTHRPRPQATILSYAYPTLIPPTEGDDGLAEWLNPSPPDLLP